MRLQFKLLLCFILVSLSLPLVSYNGILNPRIRHAARFVDESHQVVLSEHRLLLELQVMDRCLQEVEIDAFGLHENYQQRRAAARVQRTRAIAEIHSSLAKLKQDLSTLETLNAGEGRV